MKRVNSIIKLDEQIETNLLSDYEKHLQDKVFKSYATKLKLKNKHYYTNEILKSISELNNCMQCSSLASCKNSVAGHKFMLIDQDEVGVENYIKCDYLTNTEYLNNIYALGFEKHNLLNINSDMVYNDANRLELLKYMSNLFQANLNESKGIYVSGTFGSGKSFLMLYLLKYYAKQGYSCAICYFPELLIQIKNTYSDYSKNDVLENIKNVDVLVLDDLGSEKVTAWSRDEILGSILQHRMEKQLFTCITSNYKLNELENNLAVNNGVVNAKRISDRILFLTNSFELIDKNYRK